MKINFIGDSRIATIDNVMSDEDCKHLHDFTVNAKVNNLEIGNSAIEDSMSTVESEETIKYWKSKNLFLRLCPEEYTLIGKELHEKQNQLFGEYLSLIGLSSATYDSKYLEPIVVHLYRQGDNLDPHRDNHDFALVFYLSSPPEFTGGELLYTELGINITPTRGTLVISPSEELHEVLEITSGYRCAITTFISLD